jgi:transposase-like protein
MKPNPKYERFKGARFFKEIDTEEKARDLVWRSRFEGKPFVCPHCKHEGFWQHQGRPEIRECRSCHRQIRLRAGTMFQDSKTPMLVWVRAIFYVMQGKRGISALELKRQLEMKSYGTAWSILHKIRESLRQRDEHYKLKSVIELDGATFGRRETGTETEVLVAIESKDWVDEKGKAKSKAGFAKVMVAPETKQKAQEFVDQVIQKDSLVNTDGSPSLRDVKNVDVEYQVVGNDPKVLDHWLPWVHKFISNAKTWLVGTHHGVESKYLGQYLGEYTFRFNRRHDPDSLFHRALTACAIAAPKPAHALFG